MSNNQASSGVPVGYYHPQQQNYPQHATANSYVAPLKTSDGANNNNSINNKEQ